MTESSAPSQEESELLGRAIETLRAYCGVVLLSFAKHGQDLRDTVARNFIARGMSCAQSIYAVWKAGSEQDAWILHRSLLDRLFHLHELSETNGFSDFEEHSFKAIYEARHRLLSDPLMKGKAPMSLKDLQRENRQRYESISQKKLRWRRPKAEEIAKKMDLGFLYRFGYDYASMHVHPMADDGEADFAVLISPHAIKISDATVVRNSILVQSMLIQEAFNISKMRWRAIAYNFLDQLRIFLGTGDQQFHVTFYKIGQAWGGGNFDLCEPLASNDRP